MVRQDRYRIGVDIGQQRDCHASVDVDAPESHRPAGAVAGAQGNFIALIDSCRREKDADPLNVDGYLRLGKGVAVVVTQGFLGPMFADGVF